MTTRSIIIVLSVLLGVSLRYATIYLHGYVLHEYDPYFNFKVTKYIADNGFKKFISWHDSSVWYPFGRSILKTSYPGMMIATYVIFLLLKVVKVDISINTLCCLFPIIASLLAFYSVYQLTLLISDKTTAVISLVLFTSTISFLCRSIGGFYDYECFSVGLMVLCYNYYLKVRRDGFYTDYLLLIGSYVMLALSWGGYVYVINLLAVHSMFLLMADKFLISDYVSNLLNSKGILNRIIEMKQKIQLRRKIKNNRMLIKGKSLANHKLDIDMTVKLPSNTKKPEEKFRKAKSTKLNTNANKQKKDITFTNSSLLPMDQELDNPIRAVKPIASSIQYNPYIYPLFYLLGNSFTSFIPMIGKKSFLSQEQIVPLVVFVLHLFSIKSLRLPALFLLPVVFTFASSFINTGRLLDLVLLRRTKSALVESISEHNPRTYLRNIMDLYLILLFLPLGIKELFVRKKEIINSKNTNKCPNIKDSMNNNLSNNFNNNISHNISNNISNELNNNTSDNLNNTISITLNNNLNNNISNNQCNLTSNNISNSLSNNISNNLSNNLSNYLSNNLSNEKNVKPLNTGVVRNNIVSNEKHEKVSDNEKIPFDNLLKRNVKDIENEKWIDQNIPITYNNSNHNYNKQNDILYRNTISDNSFMILYLATSSIFTAKMYRLMIPSSPCFCITASLYISKAIKILSTLRSKARRYFAYFVITVLLLLYIIHNSYMAIHLYTLPHILIPGKNRNALNDFPEAHDWLDKNTEGRILAWWDYGYQINAQTKLTTFTDNNTCKWDRVALTARILLSEEDNAYDLCIKNNINYIYIISGAASGYTSDYIGKCFWIGKIAKETGFKYKVDESILKRMCYYNNPTNYDVARQRPFREEGGFKKFVNVFNSKNFIVKIFKVI